MSKILLLFVSLLIGIGIFFWMIQRVGWEEIIVVFSTFSLQKGVAIILLTSLIMATGTWKWKEILADKDIRVDFWSLFKFYLAGFAVMFLAPVLVWGGEAFRAYMIKQKSKGSWSETVASVVIDRVVEWTTNLVVVLAGGAVFLLNIGLPPKNLSLIFGGALLVFLGGIFVFYFKTLRKESITKTFGRVFNGEMDAEPLEAEKEMFSFFKKKNSAVGKVFLISSLRAGLMLARTWLLVLFLGSNISLLSSLSVLGFTYLAVMVPIPTALGTHEAIQTFAFRSLGISSSAATVFTMIIRGAESLFAFLGLGIFLKIGIKHLKKLFFRVTGEKLD